ncbi:hypothetical protein M378DRAFT_18064 [Amanita muscaria Koide BX008]|uniref:Uncharacterized protein n=1 Tax=Amanita muscaria (strain Koide BX008) TaxID=946122 RepID=A0A0C2WGQ4_AMAMK|nr:hypothetical protein M378DRAFT_18064 [Amanita muscaria Koide BX008]
MGCTRWGAEALTESDRVSVVDDDVEQPGFNAVKPAHALAATADLQSQYLTAPPEAAPATELDDDAVEVELDSELAFGSWDPTTGKG